LFPQHTRSPSEQRDLVLPEPVLAVLVVRVPTVLPVDPLEERKTTGADWTRRRKPPVVTSGHDSLVSVVVPALHPLLRHKRGARQEQVEQGGIDDDWQQRSCCSFGGSKPVTVLRLTLRKRQALHTCKLWFFKCMVCQY
jgi:hypothetical protein